MNWIARHRLLHQPLIGTFLGIGSPISAEIASRAGFDWVLIDTEHGAGDFAALVQQLQAVGCGTSAPVVRVPWNDPVVIKRTLDAGAAGIMVPYVNDAAEAARAVAAVKYPPVGIRGVARSTRAAGFGVQFDQYFASANDNTLVVVQIETPAAAAVADQIAAVDGVDVLFVGPLDMRVNLGWPDQFNPSDFDAAIDSVLSACRAHGKTAGILATPDQTQSWIDQGMRLVAVGSDSMAILNGFQSFLQSAQK